MTHSWAMLEELGEGYGFRKVRQELGITAFGANVIVMPPGMEAFWHFHDRQDELYFVHAGTARCEVNENGVVSERELGPGGLFHVSSTTPRRLSNTGDDDLVMLVIGAADGYVGRDGQLVDMADLPRRQGFGS